MIQNLPEAISNLAPNLQFVCGDTYASIEVLNDEALPSEQDLIAESSRLSAVPEKKPDGLLSWLYSNDDYLALMDSHGGIIANFQREVSENRFELALKLWNKLPVPQSLNDALFASDGPLVQFGYQDLIAFAAANSG